MRILLLGMNHESAPVEVREHFAPREVGPALRKLVSYDEIHEAVLVSTCNRVDLVVTTDRLDDARHRVMGFFHRELGNGALPPGVRSVEDCVYEHLDRDAVCHVFRVASSLDSMVVGEPQILGQMKDAYREAVESRTCGPVLSRLFQRAFATAKRVKNETRIAHRPVSVARVAVDLARQIFEEFDDKSALLLGAGEMIELALKSLHHEGLQMVRVANRTVARAEELAQRFGATAHSLEELDALLPESDIVLTCIAADRPILTLDRVREALHARRSRPVFFIDIGVPRNIDPRVDEIDSAYLYDVDDLQNVADENIGERMRESQRGELIVEEEQQQFDGWLAALKAVPTIRHLRARADAIRKTELQRMHGRMGLDDEQREHVELLTRSIVNKLLHAPLAHLRSEADSESGIASLEAARLLFALDDSSAPGADADEELRTELEQQRLKTFPAFESFAPMVFDIDPSEDDSSDPTEEGQTGGSPRDEDEDDA